MRLSLNKFALAVGSLISLTCFTMVSQCWAQPPSRGQKNKDEFWSALGDAYRQSSNNRQNLWRLLEHPAIQGELQLDESELKSIEVLNGQHFSELLQLRAKLKQGIQREILHTELVELINKQDAAFMDEVAKHCDMNRLIELDIQAYGTRAVTHAEVAKRIGLSDQKLADLREHCDEFRRKEMDQMRERIPIEEVRKLFREMDQRLNDCIKARLTSQELDALNQIKGKPFKLPEDLFEPRRRGRLGTGGSGAGSDGTDGQRRDRETGSERDQPGGTSPKDKDNCRSRLMVQLVRC